MKDIKESTQLTSDERYSLYESAVQAPENEVEVIKETYHRHFGKFPTSLREDFAGTAVLAIEWAKDSETHTALGIDLDPVPLKYGTRKHLAKLKASEKKRVKLVCENVLKKRPEKYNVIVAFNFSYFIFKQRADLLRYFKSVKSSLSKNGIFMLDIFGGTEARKELVEESSQNGFIYYWECEKYNPINDDVFYSIHFKKDGKMYRQAFTYDWRMWSLQEIRDILVEAGFSLTEVLWEGDDEEGECGNGVFTPLESVENCESFVAYIVART